MLSDAFIDELLLRTNIVDIISPHVKLKNTGSNLTGLCPFHQEKTPSFSVSPSKHFYHCFGCGKHGDAISFLRDFSGLQFMEAIETLANQAGMIVPKHHKNREKELEFEKYYEIANQANHYFQQNLFKLKQTQYARDYLKSRGLTKETLQRFELGFSLNTWEGLVKHLGKDLEKIQSLLKTGLISFTKRGSYCDRFRERIMFPIRDRLGRTTGFGGRVIMGGREKEPKYLNSPETPLFNKSKTLYGLYEARLLNRSLSSLVVVEGYLDVLSLSQMGITNVVGTLGTALADKQLSALFHEVNELYFCFDGDTAGQKAMQRALSLCLPQMKEGKRVKFVSLPAGNDPDSYIHQQGLEAFLRQMEGAKSLSDFLFDSVSTGLDLKHIDGKTELVRLARPLIAKLPPGIFQQLIWEKLSEITQIKIENLQGSLPGSTKSSHKSMVNRKLTNKQNNQKPLSLVSPAIKALALLLENPGLLSYTDSEQSFESADTPGNTLLCAIIRILRITRQWSIEGIFERLPVELVQEMNAVDFKAVAAGVPPLGVEAEFLGSIQRLKERVKEQVMEALLMKAKEQNLSPQQKNELNILLKNRREYSEYSPDS